MFNKKVLSEQFVITHKVSDLLKVDKKNLIANAIRNHVLEKRLDNEDWYADYNYVKIDDHQHLAWIHDYMRDHYRGEYGPTPILVKRGGLVLMPNENLGSHHHIDDWDYEGSPEISVLYCLKEGDKPSTVMFEYEFGRNKKRRWKQELKEDTLIIFSSYLRHSVSKNFNKDPIVALSFQFQLL